MNGSQCGQNLKRCESPPKIAETSQWNLGLFHVGHTVPAPPSEAVRSGLRSTAAYLQKRPCNRSPDRACITWSLQSHDSQRVLCIRWEGVCADWEVLGSIVWRACGEGLIAVEVQCFGPFLIRLQSFQSGQSCPLQGRAVSHISARVRYIRSSTKQCPHAAARHRPGSTAALSKVFKVQGPRKQALRVLHISISLGRTNWKMSLRLGPLRDAEPRRCCEDSMDATPHTVIQLVPARFCWCGRAWNSGVELQGKLVEGTYLTAEAAPAPAPPAPLPAARPASRSAVPFPPALLLLLLHSFSPPSSSPSPTHDRTAETSAKPPASGLVILLILSYNCLVMELTRFNAAGYRLQPRVNLRRDAQPLGLSEVINRSASFGSRIFARESDKDKECKLHPNSSTCEKPVGSMTVAIVCGCVIPAVVVAVLLLYLHRRSIKRQRAEEAEDPHKSLDFGLGDNKKAGRLQQSRESLHSLARTLGNDNQDPFQFVTAYTNSEAGSVKDSSSIYTKNSKHMSSTTGKSAPSSRMAPPRQDSFPKSSMSSSPISPDEDEKINPFATPRVPEPAYKGASPNEIRAPALQPIVPEIGTVSDYDDKYEKHSSSTPYVQQPAATRARSPQDGFDSLSGSAPQFQLPSVPVNIGMAQSASDDFPLPPQREREPTGLGLNFDLPTPMSPSIGNNAPLSAPLHNPNRGFDDYGHHDYQPEIRTSEYYDEYEDDRGRAAHRPGSPESQAQAQGLGVPQQNNKRLSVGFRPLPPDEVTESEDPEYRANRIRSFYKEYFDDSKEAPPPMPPLPQAPRGQASAGGAQYYEDYDQGYMGEAAYYDPDTNAFVMPYAEPVTRRAMTPPPAGRNRGPGGPGPRGPPRGPHGSVGGMSLQGGGPRGRPRAGSAFSPRAGSAISSRAGSSLGPRPDSSASNGKYRQQPKKKGPPPAALTTLPTPSKLRDDSFALMGSIDFAPPETFRDQATGRSSSPLGERRPYQQPRVPVAVPLVTAFEELAALPSPHMMRKSSTFTGLDFAPPKKFQDPEDRSDAGSIKSNRSGISAVQLGAIRNGAGRVSRLPGDQVFTQAALSDTLKPQWGMRQM
ncbi:hypothetical protein G7046_g7239 [Stylonectria norvegica]|nr:hypothetical protein G7046_g7239 [Stylonectria norvegica]